MRVVGFLSGIFCFCFLIFKSCNFILVAFFWNGLEMAKWANMIAMIAL